MLKLMLITNDETIAKEAENAGVDRIFIDLEIIGKKERQGHLDTHIADHCKDDIGKIKSVLKNSQILTRINPIHENTEKEINDVIEQGSDIIMLPMFKTVKEVETFIKLVDGRARTCLLLETSQALCRIEDIVKIQGIDEIHIGLNDLHLSLGVDFMFEILTGGLLDYLSDVITSHNIKFGFGGIARIGEGDIPAEYIIREHVRLKSEMVILSRTFHRRAKNINELKKQINLKESIDSIRAEVDRAMLYTQEEFNVNRENLKQKVKMKLNNIR